MTLIFIYKANYITLLPYVFLFLSIFDVWLLRSHVASFYNEVMAVSAQFQSKPSYEIKCAG